MTVEPRPKPRMEVLRDFPIKDIIFDESNPNVMTVSDMRASEEFLKDHGSLRTIIIDENNKLVDGEHLVRNHMELGKDTIDLVIRGRFKNETEKKVVRQFINYGPKGRPSREKQTEEIWTIFKSNGFEKFAKYMNKSQETFLQVIQNKPGIFIKPDDVPEKPTSTKVKTGQVYMLGNHRVMCGDATKGDDVLALIESDQPRLIFTDPPYDLKEFNYLRPFFEVQTDIEVLIINSDLGTMGLLDEYKKYFKNFFIMKLHTSPIGYGNQPLMEHRIISHFRKGKSNFLNLMDGFGTFHEIVLTKSGLTRQEKPISLPRRFIIHYAKPEEIVLDLFGGSGSTLIACELTGRNCLTMEKDPLIVDLIINRWKNATHEKVELI